MEVFKDACLPIQETMPLQSRLHRAQFYLAPLRDVLFLVVQHPVPMFAASSVAWNGQLMIYEPTTCPAMVALVCWTQTFVLVAARNAKAEKLVAILQSAASNRWGAWSNQGQARASRSCCAELYGKYSNKLGDRGWKNQRRRMGWMELRAQRGSPENRLIAKSKLNKPANATHLKNLWEHPSKASKHDK